MSNYPPGFTFPDEDQQGDDMPPIEVAVSGVSTDLFFLLSKDVVEDILLGLQELLRKDQFACDCEPSYESDTGAWVHDEENCWEGMKDHYEITLQKLEEELKDQI